MDEPQSVSVPTFGIGDASYQAAGGESGIRDLVDAFYAEMEIEPAAASVRSMHPADLDTSRDKLARFLCGWLNGPNRYREKYGPISIPGSHAHLSIGPAERDAWLLCMERAIAQQPYSDAFRHYLYAQLSVPANRVVNREA
ncbi:MAG: group II truncated hemoglobin [Gammaproteobacteria bacterium]|jgi:hemoglobin